MECSFNLNAVLNYYIFVFMIHLTKRYCKTEPVVVRRIGDMRLVSLIIYICGHFIIYQ